MKTLGIRSRVSASFVLGGLVLSVVLTLSILLLTRSSLVADAEETALSSIIDNATRVSRQVSDDTDFDGFAEILGGLSTVEGSQVMARFEDAWIEAPEFTQDDLPGPLQDGISNLQPTSMRADLNGVPHLIVGVPIPDRPIVYYEAVRLDGVESTLSTIALILVLSAATTTILAALLARWAGRRVLLPLNRVGSAAEAIAGGQLDTRLPETEDPDLSLLTHSFNDMAGALEQRIERDARFASEVSHELRSPLTTLTASVAVLEGRAHELPDRARTALQLLSSDVARFSTLVEDLLEISKYDAGVPSLEVSELRLGEFVREAAAITTPNPVPISGTAADVVIDGDKRRLAQVVANLLRNAEIHAAGTAEILLEADADTARIIVEDRGPGVAEADREVIFGRFSRGGASGRRGSDDTGTGLGLALVAEHVHLHRGRVWVEDRPDGGQGCRFVVELPRSQP